MSSAHDLPCLLELPNIEARDSFTDARMDSFDLLLRFVGGGFGSTTAAEGGLATISSDFGAF
jgi:hypothetical protein